MSYRLEICAPLREFLQYLVHYPYLPRPATLENALEQLNQMDTSSLGPLLGQQGISIQHMAIIKEKMLVELTVLLERNPQPVLVQDYLAHHFFFHDAWRN